MNIAAKLFWVGHESVDHLKLIFKIFTEHFEISSQKYMCRITRHFRMYKDNILSFNEHVISIYDLDQIDQHFEVNEVWWSRVLWDNDGIPTEIDIIDEEDDIMLVTRYNFSECALISHIYCEPQFSTDVRNPIYSYSHKKIMTEPCHAGLYAYMLSTSLWPNVELKLQHVLKFSSKKTNQLNEFVSWFRNYNENRNDAVLDEDDDEYDDEYDDITLSDLLE